MKMTPSPVRVGERYRERATGATREERIRAVVSSPGLIVTSVAISA